MAKALFYLAMTDVALRPFSPYALLLPEEQGRFYRAQHGERKVTLIQSFSTALDNFWVRIALVVATISVSCLVIPAIFTHVSLVVMANLASVQKIILKVVSPLGRVVGNLSSLAQVALSITVFVYACFSMSSFAAGAALWFITVGSLRYLVTGVALRLIALPFREPNIVDTYNNSPTKNFLLYVTMLAPVSEEIVFRLMLPVITTGVVAAIGFIATKLTSAETAQEIKRLAEKVGIVCNAAIFGMVHFANQHVDRFFQALMTGVISCMIVMPAKEQHGISGAIGAHMANNTVTITLIYLSNVLRRLVLGVVQPV